MNKNNHSLLAYLLKLNENNNIINKNTKHEGNTTQIVYNKEKWKKFRHILEFQGTNTNRLFWSIVESILAEYDQRKFSLDQYLDETDILLPNLDTEPEKVLKYLQSLPMEKVKKYEEIFTRNLIYAKAITQGELELENYPSLWRKYH